LVTVIGEALIDLVGESPNGYQARTGGSAFNVAVALARVQTRTALMARLAENTFGRMLRSAAAAEGIVLDAAPHASEPTTLAVVSLDHDGRAEYDFYRNGTADWQWTAVELRRLRPDTEVLHFGSLAALVPPGGARIHALVREAYAGGKILVSYDPNVRPAVFGDGRRARDLVERSIWHAHLIKASREDIEWLYPGRGLDDVGRRWVALGARLVVITDGPRGATAYRARAAPLQRPGRPTVVVDTIGAGDAFTAGMLSGLVRRGLQAPDRMATATEAALADILDEAVLIASVTCEHTGADPPRLRAARAGTDSPLTRADLAD
jgi:fructokinase